MRNPIIALAFTAALTACQTVEAPTQSTPATASQAQVETALKARVAVFGKATRINDAKAIIGIMPPKVMEKLAAATGQSVSKLKAGMVTTTHDVMSSATIHSMKMDVPAGIVKTVNGQRYALLPTYTDLTVAGMRTDQKTTTVAIEDTGVWYLVRVADAQSEALVKQAYPALKNVSLK